MKINTQKFTDRSENTYEVHEATTNLGLTVTLSPLGASDSKNCHPHRQGEYLSMGAFPFRIPQSVLPMQDMPGQRWGPMPGAYAAVNFP